MTELDIFITVWILASITICFWVSFKQEDLSGKLLYTVVYPDRIRISTHKSNLYGFIGEFVGTIEQNWQNSFTGFYDLQRR